MSTKNAPTGGNKPHSSASDSELPRRLARKFEQELSRLVSDLDRDCLTPGSFRSLLGGFGAILADLGREGLVEILQDRDPVQPAIEVDGQRLRYRGFSAKQWLSPFGLITVQRRRYRGDAPDSPSFIPLDQMCGMIGAFMTPDVEEMAAFGAAMLTATEVEQLLGKVLPHGPSATAVQNAVHRLGADLDARRNEIEAVVEQAAPLEPDKGVVVASLDGVMTPMREDGLAWREAGVATISIYRTGEQGPEKADTRYLARMPEKNMATLFAQVEAQVAGLAEAACETVVICDGKDSLWRAAAQHQSLRSATWILDFYHASENLMKAAKAIFGDTAKAAAWHQRHRGRMQLDPAGASNARRSMLRYAKGLGAETKRRKVVENAAAYFHEHRRKMLYADYIARGLPIGSGPVESAAKTIVQARLKRSGMRWSRDGGQHVLDLRTYLKSERWDPMWQELKGIAA